MFSAQVQTTGKHTLHLRWTAGDDFGGGDSLYAVMREYDTDSIVTGEDTYKPKLVGINDVPLAALAAAFALTTALAAALATALFTTTAVAPPPTTLTPHAPPPPPLPPTHRHRHRLHQPHHHHQVPGQFAGCCYHDKTHQCPCFDTVQADLGLGLGLRLELGLVADPPPSGQSACVSLPPPLTPTLSLPLPLTRPTVPRSTGRPPPAPRGGT
mgnify:CR=1 FL=1